MPDRPRVAVLGAMGGSPFAGVAWQVLHYLEGFRRLGCDVHYIEQTGVWPYDPVRNTITEDASFAAGYIDRVTAWAGLAGNWAYVAPDGEVWGAGRRALDRLLAECDALINLTGATVLREEHLRVPVRIYLETDPVLPQIEVAEGRELTIDLLAAHTHHFSFGERLGRPDCGVPVERFEYRPTRQPVVLDWWSGAAAVNRRYTTVGSWRQTQKDIVWRGETYYWSKDREFLKVIELPRRTSATLELALAAGDEQALSTLRAAGWRVVDGLTLSRDLHGYRDFIAGSRAEFTVAKDQNVRLRSGWFSDRSACYLAAGRPVVTQDTGFGDVVPTGAGLFAYHDLGEAVAAVEAIEADYGTHARAAGEIAREFFDAAKVLASLLERAGHG
jgi:hypothetical protein